MDMFNPLVFLSGALIGLVGVGMLIYGRKSMEPKCIGIGLVMCVYPYFVTSLALMWLIAGACLAVVCWLPRSA